MSSTEVEETVPIQFTASHLKNNNFITLITRLDIVNQQFSIATDLYTDTGLSMLACSAKTSPGQDTGVILAVC